MTSWRPMVKTGSDPTWYGNALRFATEEEARDNARDLAGRWMLVVEYGAEQSDDPPNYRWDPAQGLVAL